MNSIYIHIDGVECDLYSAYECIHVGCCCTNVAGYNDEEEYCDWNKYEGEI